MTEQTTPEVAGDGPALRKIKGPRGWDVAQAVAEHEGVCVRPLAMRQSDPTTGRSRVVPVACGATREAVCPSCARRNRRLRSDQCMQGWHLEAEPVIERRAPDREQTALMGYRAQLVTLGREALAAGKADDVDDVQEALADVDAQLAESGVTGRLPGVEPVPARRVRSTRRRADAPDLPRRRVESRTVGQVYAGRYRPSMFVTLTLGSYGPVHSARRRGGRIARCGCGRTHTPDAAILGTPVDPDDYDYRRAARDAVHFSKLVDRFWQNLRRAVGFDAQYFAAVESQRRLVPHLHAAIRGALPRALLRQVAAGTYQHVWWPKHGDPVYGGDRMPVWVPEVAAWCDPDTRQPLPTFEESLPGPDADGDQAAHVVRFGEQIDARGMLGGTDETRHHARYLTKYLTKSIGETYADASEAHRRHADRMLAELAITPCSPRCAVWLLHGIAPRGAGSRTRPGTCKGNAHKRHALGVAGRRVLVSRKWTGKTLADHAADRQSHVRGMLHAAGLVPPESSGQSSATGRLVCEPVPPGDPDVPPRAVLLLEAVATRRRWRQQYEQAQAVLAGVGAPGGRAGDGGGP
ncbi:hypothetical protein A8924_6343 [Saccharopolyspora erythraea NRRL 2338]|nr:replication initiator [Saccharopolyspora erythraea]EQD87764.1 replication initiator protein [Saccharopolyspora erythraea D]PFG98817.1 hypothetical protein A8924_6343 [Saccharopolyspora erythraea NRRL 2338]QRK88814.1 replication initiator protein [Saccharopolyspora erythraea]